MKQLVETIVKELVDAPEQISVNEMSSENMTVFEIHCAKEDLGKLIGKEGKNIKALRVIANAVATKLKKKVLVTLHDESKSK